MRHAGQALYQAKLTGRNRSHYFDADLDEEVRTHHKGALHRKHASRRTRR